MPLTNFPEGVSSYGVPLFGNLPWPTGGKVLVCDPGNTTGRASAGGDGTMDYPYNTLARAYAAARSGKNDVIVFLGDGTTSASERLAETLVWSKNAVHLLGVTAPTMIAQRCRITGESTGATFTPLITVSGNGCMFANFSMYHDYGVDPICMNVTGQRNYFYNVHIGGIGSTGGGDDAAAASLLINGGDENTFERCYIGLDTIERSTTNAEIELIGGATRNIFIDCFIASFADNAGHLFVKVDGSGDIDRFVYFKNCFFYNAVESTATTMTQAMNVHNTCGGMVILDGCTTVGCTDIAAADNGNVFITNAVATAGTSGLAVAVTR